MKNILNKANAPSLVAGTIATAALLTLGIFAVAPYIAFLAPVAALGVGLPFIIGGAVLSVAAIAISAVAINQNNTISEQKTRLIKTNTELFDKQEDLSREKGNLDHLNLVVPSNKQEGQAHRLDWLNIDNNTNQLDFPSVEAAKEHFRNLK